MQKLAKQYYEKSIFYLCKKKQTLSEANLYQNLGGFYRNIKSYEESLNSYVHSMEIYQKHFKTDFNP